jgi:hypothetical protein
LVSRSNISFLWIYIVNKNNSIWKQVFNNVCVCVLYTQLCVFLIADWLLQLKQIDNIGFGQYEISSKKFWSHLASSLDLSSTINSNFIIHLVMSFLRGFSWHNCAIKCEDILTSGFQILNIKYIFWHHYTLLVPLGK